MAATSKKRAPVRFSAPGPAKRYAAAEIDELVREVISRIADQWTMLALEVLAEHGTLRFSRLAELVGGVSQKMLTKTLRQMENDGFVTRRVYPVVPPRVEYELTPLGLSLGEAFCGVWHWAERHHAEVAAARKEYGKRSAAAPAQ